MGQGESNVDPNREGKAAHSPPWFLFPWILLVFLLIFACGQMALMTKLPETTQDTRSKLRADYGQWQFMPMAPLDPILLSQAALDRGLSEVLPLGVSPRCLLPGSDCSPTASPSPTALQLPTSTPTAVPPTPTSTATLASIWPTATTEDPPSIPPTATMTPEPPSPTPDTPTATPITPTPTSTPCGNCEPDIGTPDGDWRTLPSGSELVFNLSSPIYVNGDPDWDLVYFERQNGWTGEVLLDLVVVKIGVYSTGEWFVVFDWGNGVVDANTNVSSVPEGPNAPIPMSDLYGTPPLNTGILINVDITTVPTGMYDRVSITGPTPGPGTPAYGAGDLAEVDAVQVLPTPTPAP